MGLDRAGTCFVARWLIVSHVKCAAPIRCSALPAARLPSDLLCVLGWMAQTKAGCWDGYGQTGTDYTLQSGAQITVVRNIIKGVAGV